MSKVLVTGGAGYIGNRVVENFLKNNVEVVVLDNGLFGYDSLSEYLFDKKFTLIKGDIRKREDIIISLKEVDTVVHLAGLVGNPACTVDRDIAYDTNIQGTRNLLDCCKKHGIKHFIFGSSCSVYGYGTKTFTEASTLNPVDYYAETKLSSEKDLTNYKNDFQISILRFSTVFGLSRRMRFDLAVNIMTANSLLNNQIDVYGGNQERPFVHCKDIAEAVSFLVNQGVAQSNFEIYNIGNTDHNYTLLDVAKTISNFSNRSSSILEHIDDVDKRSYNVSFNKLENLGFSAKRDLSFGIEEMIQVIESGIVSNPYSELYSNYKIAKNMYLEG